MFGSLTRWNANRSYSLYEPLTLSLRRILNSAFQQFPWVLQLWRFFIKWYQKEWSIKLRIDNGGWHETLNLVLVSRCEMLHFVTSYRKQNKSRKRTLESAQNGLEVIFNKGVSSHQDNVDSHCAFNWFAAGKVGEHRFRKLGGLFRNNVNTERSLKSKQAFT